MNFEDEKDYIMRMIKEMVRMLISLVLGKSYVQVELPPESKYGISGDRLTKWKEMIDKGYINDAENILLDSMDYTNREMIAELVFFYEYTSEKDDAFLEQNNYSREEILEGLKQLASRTGYENMMEIYLTDRD